MILNPKRLNENMPYIHFKMKTLKSILTLMTPNCYMAKVDTKDANYSVPILLKEQQYLKCYFRGKLYQFTCLPNGLCSGQRKFTKLLKLPQGFIDDLITLGRSFAECERILNLLQLFLTV